MLNENLRGVIRKLVDAESFSNNVENYKTAVKVVKCRLNEYARLKTGAERLSWLKTIVFDVCHRGLRYRDKRRDQIKDAKTQIKQAKILLRALKYFIN